MEPKKAYVTLLTKNSYLAAALVLNESLRRVGSKYPLVIMSTLGLPSEGREAVTRQGVEILTVDSLKPPPSDHNLFNHDARFADAWTKLRYVKIWCASCWVEELMPCRAFGLVDFEVRPLPILRGRQ